VLKEGVGDRGWTDSRTPLEIDEFIDPLHKELELLVDKINERCKWRILRSRSLSRSFGRFPECNQGGDS
jgi:hypothetical protein